MYQVTIEFESKSDAEEFYDKANQIVTDVSMSPEDYATQAMDLAELLDDQAYGILPVREV